MQKKVQQIVKTTFFSVVFDFSFDEIINFEGHRMQMCTQKAVYSGNLSVELIFICDTGITRMRLDGTLKYSSSVRKKKVAEPRSNTIIS